MLGQVRLQTQLIRRRRCCTHWTWSIRRAQKLNIIFKKRLRASFQLHARLEFLGELWAFGYHQKLKFLRRSHEVLFLFLEFFWSPHFLSSTSYSAKELPEVCDPAEWYCFVWSSTLHLPNTCFLSSLIKKRKEKFSSYRYKEIQMGSVSHIWGRAS